MKKLLTCFFVLFFLSTNNVFAQRKTVYLEPFKGDASIYPELLTDVRLRIYDAVAKLGRVTLVDGHNYGTAAAQDVNADYILRGYLVKAKDGIKMGEKEGEDVYKVEYDGSMELVDATNGNVIGKINIGGNGSKLIRLPDMSRRDRGYREEARRLEDQAADDAYSDAVSLSGTMVESLIDENIIIEVRITGITDAKGDEVKGVTIDRGTFSGVSHGERFNVFVTENIGNYPKKTKIAELRVNSQPTSHSATCKVTSGKKEMKSAMDRNAKLTVVSRKAKFFD